jgi:hypothetical protein
MWTVLDTRWTEGAMPTAVSLEAGWLSQVALRDDRSGMLTDGCLLGAIAAGFAQGEQAGPQRGQRASLGDRRPA